MAFDGITINALASQLNMLLKNGRIVKITQPENEEIILHIKNEKNTYRLLISVSPSLPIIYIVRDNKKSPETAPNFCMVLRKHLSGGRILSVETPGLERAVIISVEHLDEMGDTVIRNINIELMGKHSNIILTNEKNVIIDSLKRVSNLVSSVREVLPGREYFIPNTCNKLNSFTFFDKNNAINRDRFADEAGASNKNVLRYISDSYTGLSHAIVNDVLYKLDINPEEEASKLDETNLEYIYNEFSDIMSLLKNNEYSPKVILDAAGKMRDFFVTKVYSYASYDSVEFESISDMLYYFYSEKNIADNMRQKTADLRKHINSILEKDIKKYDLQLKQLKDSEGKDNYKIYGELLLTYAHMIKEGSKKAEVLNYYTNENIIIPLDENKTVMENANRYYDKYNKLKRTGLALEGLCKNTEAEIKYLEEIMTYVDIATGMDEINQIRAELKEKGYIKKGYDKKNKDRKLRINVTHYKYDNYDIYLGRNNIQNEEVTFKIATGNDWWFHAKNVPGSHVVCRAGFENQATEWDMPDEVFEVCAYLAAVNSKNKGQKKVEVDYTRRKHIKKTPGGEKGYVIYDTNYSMTIDADRSDFSLTQV